jgi:transposase
MERQLKTAQRLGHLRQVTYLLAILAVMDGQRLAEVALILRVHARTVAAGVGLFCCDGIRGAPRKHPTGRPSKLTPTQKAALAPRIDEGPLQAGFSSAGWRSPMVQPLIDDRFGVFSNVFSRAQLLKNLGFSDHTAAFVSEHLDQAKRQAWCTTTWPPLLRRANERKALLLVGDEAAFPQGGTRSSTWARRGHQPLVRTSGQRQGYQVFGLSAYFTGRFWYQGQEGRLHAEPSIAFLTRVLAQTTPPLMLIQEGARYHTSAAMPRFLAQPLERLTSCQLPSYSPDDNPIEQLWKQVNKDGTPLHYVPTFEALTDTVEHALLPFATTPAEILALCSLPTALAPAASVCLVRKSFS